MTRLAARWADQDDRDRYADHPAYPWPEPQTRADVLTVRYDPEWASVETGTEAVAITDRQTIRDEAPRFTTAVIAWALVVLFAGAAMALVASNADTAPVWVAVAAVMVVAVTTTTIATRGGRR